MIPDIDKDQTDDGMGNQHPRIENRRNNGRITVNFLEFARAHWLTREFIAWPFQFPQDSSFSLHYDPFGCLNTTIEGVEGGKFLPLEFVSHRLGQELAEKFPHLSSSFMLKIPQDFLGSVPDILRGQCIVQALDNKGKLLDATALQLPGVLDELYANDAQLGISWKDDVPSISVWAPTAINVRLHLFTNPSNYKEKQDDENHLIIQMARDPKRGIWSAQGTPEWKHKYYLYEVNVYVYQKKRVETNWVTDPYSISLSANSQLSQIIDLNDSSLIPDGWTTYEKPSLKAFTDIVLYELHLRDFSIRDQSCPEEHRGKYLAFTHLQSNGMQHLDWLVKKGITHLHLLPVFDFATVNENKEKWKTLDWDLLQSLPPDSEDQQQLLKDLRGQDGYNWGYDPFHFTVPEGSYCLNPGHPVRILEFRKMIQYLNRIGLRVVMDVVYNHTHTSGQSRQSVLDRIVPGYYHRLDENGQVATSTCCANTASEHAMMRKLMIDSVLTWTTSYKLDGFRFDLMGHHMKTDMMDLRVALDKLTLEEHGADGKKVYLYGEGWDFGEVSEQARGINASQINMAGTGIGTFNDRIRDAVRGGRPFSDPREQGFVTGLYLDPNDSTNQTPEAQRVMLLNLKDQLRISLAGNLADFQIINKVGDLIKGKDFLYHNQPSGYTHHPQENILYVSAHDNETLFDAIQYKVPQHLTLCERVKIQILALSFVILGQGIPFIHAGSEILRSKSMDRDSYDSTDWLNAIDWTYQDNNWGHGLPPFDKNGDQWSIIRERLSNPRITPSQADILKTRELFGKFLSIRSSSPLFHLSTSSQIEAMLHFHNTGPDQEPGLIVMSILDDEGNPLDHEIEVIFIIFNVHSEGQTFQLKEWSIDHLHLHPTLKGEYTLGAKFDSSIQTFFIPPRSTMVFISPSRPVSIL